MFIFKSEITGTAYKITFRYGFKTVRLQKGNFEIPFTICSLYNDTGKLNEHDKKQWNLIRANESSCSTEDKNNFSKDKGRKIALEKTISGYFNHRERTNIWKIYFEKTKSLHKKLIFNSENHLINYLNNNKDLLDNVVKNCL